MRFGLLVPETFPYLTLFGPLKINFESGLGYLSYSFW